MKLILQIILVVFITYAIVQTIYTRYFFNKSHTLTKITYVGQSTLGDKKLPQFNILIDGDSVGAGVGASSFQTSLAGRIAEYYSDKHHVVLTNNSVSGSKMQDLVDRKTPNNQQDLTMLVVSSNDLFRLVNQKQFKESTEKVLKKYSSNSKKLIIIGPGRIYDAGALPFFVKFIYKNVSNNYATAIEEVAKQYPNVIYINPLTTTLKRSDYGAMDASDGFHPNDEGYRFWFDLVKPNL